MTNFNLQAVIFDMDGLVLDSEAGYQVAWREAAAAMGQNLSEDFCLSLNGMSGRGVQEQLLSHCGEGFDLAEFSRLSSQHWLRHVEHHGIPVKTGFFKLLTVLQTYEVPYAMATNSHQQNALFCLERAGLTGIFTTLIARDHVARPKPAPDLFLHAAAALGTAINRCLVLEDSLPGVTGARAAGAQVFAVAEEPVLQRLTAAHQRFAHLGQVADLLATRLPGAIGQLQT